MTELWVRYRVNGEWTVYHKTLDDGSDGTVCGYKNDKDLWQMTKGPKQKRCVKCTGLIG